MGGTKRIQMEKSNNIDRGYFYLINFHENPTFSAYVKKNKIKRNTFFKYLREKNIIDDEHCPFEAFEDWFELRSKHPLTYKWSLSITPKGEVELLKFAHELKDEDGIDIFN